MTQLSGEGFKNFFKYFKPGYPHQANGVETLRQEILKANPALLEDDADWINTYRKLNRGRGVTSMRVPYCSQLDNYKEASRTCMSSSCAMVAMFYERIESDDDYIRLREQYGDTTNPTAHIHALESLGLSASFHYNGSAEELDRRVEKALPTPVGWLHKGRGTVAPHGGGHYSVVVGASESHYFHHDPMGFFSLDEGRYLPGTLGESVAYERGKWLRRWLVENDRSGWFLDIHP